MFPNNTCIDNQTIKDQLLLINNKLDTLTIDINILKEQLNNLDVKINAVNSSCKNMDEHIGFVENVYDVVKSPFQKVLNYYYKDSDSKQLSEVKRICNNK
jgi:chromosome segregation ATPase